jgi:hypothetical protein
MDPIADKFRESALTSLPQTRGADWKKMRKLIASCFIDQNFEVVWRESIAQAVDMGRYWGLAYPLRR